MQQLLHIHGGESFETHDAYLEFLRDSEVEDPFNPQEIRFWKHSLPEVLGPAFVCAFPRFPNASNAVYEEWAIFFEKLLPYCKDEVVFTGHSLGANFLANWLAENKSPVSIAQLHLIAGCFGVAGGFGLPESLQHIEEQCEQIHLYHSRDDEIVPFSDAERYAAALPSAKTHWFDDRGHFLQEDFPELIANIHAR